MQARKSISHSPSLLLLHSQIYGSTSSLLLCNNEWRQFETKKIYITSWNWCFLSALEYSARLSTRCDKKLIEIDLLSSIIAWNTFLHSEVSTNSELAVKLHKIGACLQVSPIPLLSCSICNSISFRQTVFHTYKSEVRMTTTIPSLRTLHTSLLVKLHHHIACRCYYAIL
jgi:hypothetical protein